ncbi:hypothetical protein [uncultured Clostridium sp.]|uniref:hypothetical protein n=1 Tax=uncultured Clostridium sp. TaxID=59620 RepID=UPI0026ED6BD9|nr:hypothetical protein [uncultured Clostridium sp.]
MSTNTWLELRDVVNLEPETKIWCVSMDGRVDFLMTAGEIKDTVGNFDWTDVKFGLVLDPKPKKEEVKVEDKSIKTATIKGKKTIHKIKILSSGVKEDIEERANAFMENKNVVDIKYQTESRESDMSLMVTYTVMIHYVELD